MINIAVQQMLEKHRQSFTKVLKNINRTDQYISIILIKLSTMNCTTSKTREQKTEQQFLFSNPTLKQEIFEKQARNLAKTEEVGIKVKSNPTSSEQGLPISAETNSKRESQKIIYLKSINHNFQKHAVVTIKKLTKNIDSAFGQGLISILAHRMWNVFLTSGLKSKQILVILFGAATMQDQRYKDLLKRCYFGQLCSYRQQTVRSAQNFLRQIVVSLLSEERVRRNIQECRHIKNREAFYHYFMEFVQNLKKGPLLQFRIGRQTSKRISQRMNTFPAIISNQTHKRIRNRLRKMK